MNEHEHLTTIDDGESWRLLKESGVGILATVADGLPDMFPINYLTDGRTLLFRTAPGTKVTELERAPHAAFAVQGQDADGHWSVVVRGDVEVLTDQVETIGAAALELASWAPGSKRVFLRLTPASIQGRRVPRADLARAVFYG